MGKILEVSSTLEPQLCHRGICLLDVASWQTTGAILMSVCHALRKDLEQAGLPSIDRL